MKIIVVQLDDSLSSAAAAIIAQLQELGAEPDTAALAREQTPTPPLPNRPKMDGLKARCGTKREIRTDDVILVSGVDESQFYRWQRGAYVGKNTRCKIEGALALSAAEFLTRLDAPETLNGRSST
jgi:hypothetical protein